MYSFYITICTLFFNILLLSAYFPKKRVKRVENYYYSGVLITSFLGLLVELLGAYIVLVMHVTPDMFIYKAEVKGVYITYILWTTFIVLYFITIIHTNREKNLFTIQVITLLMLLLDVIALCLPIRTIENNGMITPTGPCVMAINALAIFYMSVMFIFSIINRKVVGRRESVPLAMSIMFFFTNLYLQFYMQLFLTHTFTTFVAFIMYFTIQNPDVKMLEQVEIAKNRADKANKAKSDFLSSMSHEIRTPLNAIVGFSEDLKEKNLDMESKEEVEDIIKASQILLETVNGILDISKIEANKIEIINSTYDFDDVFNDLVVLSKARLGDDKPIDFKYQKSSDIPRYLYGDSTRVKQIIINLLTNAIKYTEKGHINFNVSCINEDKICKLIISVEDTGMGIKEENIPKLFSKFERLDNENSGIEGTGLGLAITKKLVEMMNGTITVQSKYGRGSLFTVTLEQKISDKPTEEVCSNINNITIEHDLSNKNVLVVDDNTLNLKVIKNLLKPYNIVPEEITSGIECLNMINQGRIYDIILLDDMMPELSGKETFKQLKEINGFNTPVVALTANAIEGMKEEYLDLGFDDYLAKPIDREELKRIIDKFLDN